MMHKPVSLTAFSEEVGRADKISTSSIDDICCQDFGALEFFINAYTVANKNNYSD